MRDIVSVEIEMSKKSRHAAAGALEAIAKSIRDGDISTIPARFTFGMGLNLSVTEHDE